MDYQKVMTKLVNWCGGNDDPGTISQMIQYLQDEFISSVPQTDNLKLFVFTDSWDHSEDSWTHPDMVVAKNMDEAIQVLIKNTWGSTGKYSLGNRVEYGVVEEDILLIERIQDNMYYQDLFKVMEYEIADGTFIRSSY